MRRLLILPLLLTVGCCKPQVITLPAPIPTVVVEPAFRVTALPADATLVQIYMAYELDLAEWVAYAKKLEILTWGKTTPASVPASPLGN